MLEKLKILKARLAILEGVVDAHVTSNEGYEDRDSLKWLAYHKNRRNECLQEVKELEEKIKCNIV